MHDSHWEFGNDIFCKELLVNYLRESLHEDHATSENDISQNYNACLNYHELLNQINIVQHHRILQKALNYYNQAQIRFEYSKFIKYISESITKYGKYENQSLLIYFNSNDFKDCLSELSELKSNPLFESHYLDSDNERFINLVNQGIISGEKYTEIQNHIRALEIANSELQKQNQTMSDKIRYHSLLFRSILFFAFIVLAGFALSIIVFQRQHSYWINEMKRLNQLKEANKPHITFPFEKYHRVIGILKHLGNEVHRKDSVLYYIQDESFNASKENYHFNGFCTIRLVDYEGKMPRSINEPYWIEWDFGSKKINPTNYTFMSHSCSNWYHPKTWEIQASTDYFSWDVLDRRENCSDLNGSGKSMNFACQTLTHKRYQFLRFILIDNWKSKIEKFPIKHKPQILHSRLVPIVNDFDFFGKLYII